MGNETQPDRATTADPQLGAREPREMNIDLSGAARIHVNVGRSIAQVLSIPVGAESAIPIP
jgi:hypothetical protein